MADDNTKSIRRIMKGVKEDPTGLGLADDYKGIGTSRGEAFINARGDVTGSGSEGSGDDKDEQPSSGTPDTGTPDDNDTGGGGGINRGSDPTTSLGGDVDAVVPAIDTDTQVGTVTGTDPASGNVTSFNPNTIDGIEYVPPPGWFSPESEDGLATIYNGVPITGANFCATLGCPPSNVKGTRGATLWDSTSGFSYTTGYFQLTPSFVDVPEGFTSTAPGACIVCGTDFDNEFFPGTYISIESTSSPPPILSGDWPSDSSCQVVYDSAAGGYKGNERDPDCSAAQLVASDSIIVRSVDDPNKFYKFTKLADGGTKITEVDSGGVIIPDSVIKTIDEGGRFSNVYPESLDASII